MIYKDSNGWYLRNGTWICERNDNPQRLDPWGNPLPNDGKTTDRGWEVIIPNVEYPENPIPLLVVG